MEPTEAPRQKARDIVDTNVTDLPRRYMSASMQDVLVNAIATALEEEGSQYKTLLQDACDTEDRVRALLVAYDKSSPEGVIPLDEVVATALAEEGATAQMHNFYDQVVAAGNDISYLNGCHSEGADAFTAGVTEVIATAQLRGQTQGIEMAAKVANGTNITLGDRGRLVSLIRALSPDPDYERKLIAGVVEQERDRVRNAILTSDDPAIEIYKHDILAALSPLQAPQD